MRKKWSYSEGGYGHKVRVFERPGRKNLYISYWDIEKGAEVTTSLGHPDREQAIRECRQTSDLLRLGFSGADEIARGSGALNSGQTPREENPAGIGPAEEDRESAAGEDKATWEYMFERYHEVHGKHKRGTQPTEDLRRQKIWLAFFREAKVLHPAVLNDDHVSLFIRMRAKGTIEVPGVKLQKPKGKGEEAVTPRTIQADIVFLLTVLNWAVKAKHEGLLSENPISLPKGLATLEPARPVATQDDIVDLLRVANEVDPSGLYECFIHLHDALGWRVTAVCNIKASDLKLKGTEVAPHGLIRKNPEVDKKNVGKLVPLSEDAQATFEHLLQLRDLTTKDEEYLFPAPKDPSRPWTRFRERDLRERAEKLAGIPPLGGSHAVRRKWVTERKDHPLPDIMAAGGWKDRRSMEAYLHDDTATTYQVVSRPTRPIRRTEEEA